MKRKRECICAGFVLVLAAADAPADNDNCPPFPVPEGMQLKWVAPDMKFNGVPMQIREFNIDKSVDEVLSYYKQQWPARGKRPGAVEYPLGDWQVVAAPVERCFYTVQARTTGAHSSSGILAVTHPPSGPVVQRGHDFPMMFGSKVVNDIDSVDGPKIARTLVLINQFSPQANADFYQRTLSQDGWQTVSSVPVPMPAGDGYMLVMQRGVSRADMSISRKDQDTTVLVNIVDKP
ncbi:MAG TPA: hypothetical protein VMT94_09835 [Burkholderiales bacterium]|nr:hypothetical protein [Burkholderiales bacterium]